MCAECNYFSMKVFGWAFLTQPCTSWYCPERKRERERVRLLSSLVPFVFSLGFVDDDKPLPEAKFHRLQSVNVEVGCCLLVPQYCTIFLWDFKVLVEKSKDFGLAYKVYFINLDSDISFGITFDVHKLQKKYFFFKRKPSFPTQLMMLKSFCNQYDLKFPPRQNRRLQSSRLL